MKHLALVALILLAGCSKPQPAKSPQTSASSDLERAAIAAGVIPDPDDTDITGLYARDTDRVCIVPDSYGYKIGAFVDYGESQTCSARGQVTRVGETLHVEFNDGCSFDASFDGTNVIFPGNVPDACQKSCSGRASLGALEAERLSEAVSEASTMRDSKGRLLCGG
ncbi:hypothetical protein BH09PSE4_BH09PSE4_05470 [soil metagenome]